MATILAVDDNKEHLTALRDALRSRGHAVETTRTGRLAIELGLRLRPDLLIAEWLLCDGPGVFRIAEALRSIRPETRALILTRYPSPDVRQMAIEAGFLGCLSQPVDLAKIDAVIEKGLAAPPSPVTTHVALVEYDAASRIVFANAAALEILQLPPDLGPDPRLSRLIGNRNLKQVETQRSEWVPIKTLSSPPIGMEMLSLHAEGGRGRALMLPGPTAAKQQANPVVRALVDGGSLTLRSQARKRLPPRALLIDPDRIQRRLLLGQLDTLGVPCHSTESLEQGLALLEADPEIELVFIDYGPGSEAVAQTVLRMQDLRPEVQIVGMSVGMRKLDFEKMHVLSFLAKPAAQERLREIIAGARDLDLARQIAVVGSPARRRPRRG
jgi:two-component system response regulator RegA